MDSVGTNDLIDVNTVGSEPGKVNTAASYVSVNAENLFVNSPDFPLSSNDFTLGLVDTKTPEKTTKGKNYYTQEELEKVIKEMSRVLG